ncbi:MAG TPA: serine hydrolase domain-containing protein [Vicinamibacterales bacterium]
MADAPSGPSGVDSEAARAVIVSAVEAKAFPCAVVEVGTTAGAVWTEAFGTLTGEPDGPAATPATIFDLASLTKVIATTTLAMRLCDEGRLALDQPVGRWCPAWCGTDRDHVTVADLLAHCAGLTAHLPLYESLQGRTEFVEAICRLALEYEPRRRAVYSDLGFILLGVILEQAGGRDLGVQFGAIAKGWTSEPLAFSPPRSWRDRIAPTGVDRWRGRLLVGEVHDRNCWVLGGRAGHAGLFGTAAAVGRFARLVLAAIRQDDPTLASPDTVRLFARRTPIPGSTRALGWDTMKPTSSCGALMSTTAIGHTGFTGTSLWIDYERDLYAVLLTNRVHPSAENQHILSVRPAFHDAVVAAWPRTGL